MRNFQNHEFKSCSIINGLDVAEEYEVKKAPFDNKKHIGKVSYVSKDK